MSGVNDTMTRPRKKQVLMVMKKIDSIDEMEDVVSASKTIEQVAKQIESTRKAWGNSSVRYWGQAPGRNYLGNMETARRGAKHSRILALTRTPCSEE